VAVSRGLGTTMFPLRDDWGGLSNDGVIYRCASSLGAQVPAADD